MILRATRKWQLVRSQNLNEMEFQIYWFPEFFNLLYLKQMEETLLTSRESLSISGCHQDVVTQIVACAQPGHKNDKTCFTWC